MSLNLPFGMHLTMIISTVSIPICNAVGELYDEIINANDLSQFSKNINMYSVSSAYAKDVDSSSTIFAEIDDVFTRQVELRSLTQNEVLSRFVDDVVSEISNARKWDTPMIVKNSIQNGKVYLAQFEDSPGNFSYFANNGRICNHAVPSWKISTSKSYLYKVCSWFGHVPFGGTVFDLIRTDDLNFFVGKQYSNNELTLLRASLVNAPESFMFIFGASGLIGYHTFFLPSDRAFHKIQNRNYIDNEILLAHVTGKGRLLFTEAWLFDYGVHWLPTVKIGSVDLEDNRKVLLSIKNLLNRQTGQLDTYVVSKVMEHHGVFRKGVVWSKIITPNIPVDNGVAHIIDSVLAVVTESVEQIVFRFNETQRLRGYLYVIGQKILNYLSSFGTTVTFFAPINYAFDLIPRDVELRLLNDPVWLEQVLMLHIILNKDFTTDQINNNTVLMTVDDLRHLRFQKEEWSKHMTYYVLGGGVRAVIYQEDIAATNGVVHFIDRVLGIPYETMYSIIKNDTSLQKTASAIDNTQLRDVLHESKVIKSVQNFTFFAPSDDAWSKLSPDFRRRMFDGDHYGSLQFILKRHMIQGQALTLADLRRRQYIMMNDELVVIRRKDSIVELYWPYGNKVARLLSDGEATALNGFIHRIDNVLADEEDLTASTARLLPHLSMLLLVFTLARFGI